jgi:hypothetical protein
MWEYAQLTLNENKTNIVLWNTHTHIGGLIVVGWYVDACRFVGACRPTSVCKVGASNGSKALEDFSTLIVFFLISSFVLLQLFFFSFRFCFCFATFFFYILTNFFFISSITLSISFLNKISFIFLLNFFHHIFLLLLCWFNLLHCIGFFNLILF